MINMDGFILTHAYEPVDTISQGEADKFLPPYEPEIYLDVENPITMGPLEEPQWYMETRYRIQEAQMEAKPIIKRVAQEFKEQIGRYYGGLIDTYKIDGAETLLVAMGSVIGTIKDAIDELRDKGEKVGLLKIRCFRPFPNAEIIEALKDVKNVAVLEKAVSLGASGIVADEIKGALYHTPYRPEISNFFLGLGGRDISKESIIEIYNETITKRQDNIFVDIHPDIVEQIKIR